MTPRPRPGDLLHRAVRLLDERGPHQCRPADDPRGPGRLDDPAAVGGGRLHPHDRLPPARHRLHGGPIRAQTGLHDRTGPVRRRLRPVRAGPHDRLAHRRPRAAGGRRGHADAGRPVDHLREYVLKWKSISLQLLSLLVWYYL